MSDVIRELNANHLQISEVRIKPNDLAELIQLIDKGTISGKIAKTVFIEMWKTGQKAEAVVKEDGKTVRGFEDWRVGVYGAIW